MFYDLKSGVHGLEQKTALHAIEALLPVDKEVAALWQDCKGHIRKKEAGKSTFKPISWTKSADHFHDLLLKLKATLLIQEGWEFEVPQKGVPGKVKIARLSDDPAK